MVGMDRVSTGIQGLDELLGGGLPRGRSILVVGSPGSGKTTLAMQFLVAGSRLGEVGIYITLDERPDHVKENLAGFGWDIDGLEEAGRLIILDGTPLRRHYKSSYPSHEAAMPTLMPELTLKGLIRTVRRLVSEEGATRIAIDPITSLILRYHSEGKRRRALLFLFDTLAATEATSLITSELRTSILDRSFQAEEFLSQGVILLHTIVRDGSVARAIQVEKMRGIAHDTQLRPYLIGPKGIEVFPRDRVF